MIKQTSGVFNRSLTHTSGKPSIPITEENLDHDDYEMIPEVKEENYGSRQSNGKFKIMSASKHSKVLEQMQGAVER